MTLRTSRHPLRWCGGLCLAALMGCAATKTRPDFFQEQGKAFKKSLRDEAKYALPSLADDAVVIGSVANSRGRPNLTYFPWEMRVPKGQKTAVSWISWDGPFTLTFKPVGTQTMKDTPLENAKTQLDSTFANGLHSAGATVMGNEAGYYYFKVTLTLPSGEPLQDLYCPPIIIEVPPPPPPPGG